MSIKLQKKEEKKSLARGSGLGSGVSPRFRASTREEGKSGRVGEEDGRGGRGSVIVGSTAV